MTKKQSLFTALEQIELSKELLCLLKWLITHDIKTLEKIVKRALKRNFNHHVELDTTEHNALEQLAPVVNDFLTTLDVLLVSATYEQELEKKMQQALIPSLSHIDTNICNQKTVTKSLYTVVKKQSQQDKTQTEQELFKELLKQWAPTKLTKSN